MVPLSLSPHPPPSVREFLPHDPEPFGERKRRTPVRERDAPDVHGACAREQGGSGKRETQMIARRINGKRRGSAIPAVPQILGPFVRREDRIYAFGVRIGE
jgi:hypothetical protein